MVLHLDLAFQALVLTFTMQDYYLVKHTKRMVESSLVDFDDPVVALTQEAFEVYCT